MSEKLIRCVQIKGNRVKMLPENIARNPVRMKQIGFMVQEIPLEHPPVEDFPVPVITSDAEPEVKKAPTKRKTKAK